MLNSFSCHNVFYGMDRGVTFGSYGDGVAEPDKDSKLLKPVAAEKPSDKTEARAPGPDMPTKDKE